MYVYTCIYMCILIYTYLCTHAAIMTGRSSALSVAGRHEMVNVFGPSDGVPECRLHVLGLVFFGTRVRSVKAGTGAQSQICQKLLDGSGPRPLGLSELPALPRQSPQNHGHVSSTEVEIPWTPQRSTGGRQGTRNQAHDSASRARQRLSWAEATAWRPAWGRPKDRHVVILKCH